jgi:AcrR family transcriptional regulator
MPSAFPGERAELARSLATAGAERSARNGYAACLGAGPVKRRAKKSPAAPRARIVQAALAQFAARSVAGSSIQDVADRAGMSKQALMHHFPNKPLLRDAVYAELAERLRALFPSVAASLVSRSYDRYRAIIDEVTLRFDQAPEVARFIAFELLERPDALMEWIRSETAPWLGLVVGVVDQQGDQALPVDPEAHVTVLAMMMLSVSALAPRKDKKLHARVVQAALQVMHLGSHLKIR